jgi:hypothetical protein
MTRRMIRDQTKPETIEKNTQLVQNVFKELHATASSGTFSTSFATKTEPRNERLTDLRAFDVFRDGGERRASDLIALDVEIIGSYNMSGPV